MRQDMSTVESMGSPAARPTVGTWRHVVGRAVRAPSVHNTQPWRFAVRDGVLELATDRTRQLHVLDPRGRQLHISCGCALLNARVAMAAAGVAVTVDRRRDPIRPELVARLLATGGASDSALAALEPAIDERRTNRRRFSDEDVDPAMVATLVATARLEDAELVPVVHDEHRLAVARLSQLADRVELADPAYRAELRRWTTDDPRRNDGVPAYAVPQVDGTAEDDIPLRDFDTAGMGWLPGNTHNSSGGCLLLLTTHSDDEKGGRAPAKRSSVSCSS
jgi:nitroreductase